MQRERAERHEGREPRLHEQLCTVTQVEREVGQPTRKHRVAQRGSILDLCTYGYTSKSYSYIVRAIGHKDYLSMRNANQGEEHWYFQVTRMEN